MEILVLLVAGGVFTQHGTNQPPISATKLAWIGPSADDVQQQRQSPFLTEDGQSESEGR